MTLIRPLIMSLMVLLPSSSFFWQSYVQASLTDNEISPSLLALAKNREYLPAFAYLMDQQPRYSQSWLHYAHKVARQDADTAYLTALFYRQEQQYKQANLWLEQGVKLHHQPSLLALISLQKTIGDKNTLHRIFEQYGKAKGVAAAAIEFYLEQGNINKATQYIEQLPKDSHLLAELNHYAVLDKSQTKLSSHLSCSNSVQLFATNLADLRHASSLIKKFQQHKLAAKLCFTSPRFVDINQLNCQASQHQAIQCQESDFPDVIKTSHAKYIGLVLPKGGANVYQGIIYLARDDTVDVFAHELSHLLGFADEYRLRASHQFCQKGAFKKALNIVVMNKTLEGEQAKLREQVLAELPWGKYIKAHVPIMIKHGDKWRLGTPDNKVYKNEIGLHLAKTCQSASLSSFKPLRQRTQLEYFETPFPNLYLQLLTSDDNSYAMPSHRLLYQM